MQNLPVFTDESGRRWRRVRRLSLGLGIATTLAALVVVAGVLVPPLLPNVTLGIAARLPGLPRLHTTREQKIRDFVRHGYAAAGLKPPKGVRPDMYLPIHPKRAAGPLPTHPITAGFYVNWEDNSRSSVISHVRQLDWIIGEGAVLSPAGDSV